MGHVNHDVVVRFYKILSMTTISVSPFHGKQRFSSQVAVVVHEISLNDVLMGGLFSSDIYLRMWYTHNKPEGHMSFKSLPQPDPFPYGFTPGVTDSGSVAGGGNTTVDKYQYVCIFVTDMTVV